MRSKRLSLWDLPSPAQFVDEVLATVWDGGAILQLTAAVPKGLEQALSAPLIDEDFQPRCLVATSGVQPLKQLADAAGCPTDLKELVNCARLVLIVDGTTLQSGDHADWQVFLSRFAQARATVVEGATILFRVLTCAEFDRISPSAPSLPSLSWADRPRRIDARIWAELNQTLRGSGLLQSLAVDLAVELCGWRFDLVADLVTQRVEDLLSPNGWLNRNEELAIDEVASLDGAPFQCPLALFSAEQMAEIRNRIWRAQLSTLFPQIEKERLRLIEQYREILRIDSRQNDYQVKSVEDIELGGILFQLRSQLSRKDAEHISALKRMRNNLAHRQLIDPDDFLCAFSRE